MATRRWLLFTFNMLLTRTILSAGLGPGTGGPQCTYACGAIDILPPCPDTGYTCNCDVIVAQAQPVGSLSLDLLTVVRIVSTLLYIFHPHDSISELRHGHSCAHDNSSSTPPDKLCPRMSQRQCNASVFHWRRLLFLPTDLDRGGIMCRLYQSSE